MTTDTKHNYCLNCKVPYSDEADLSKEVFCINCGQSNRDSKLSFGRLMKDAISNVFNLDSRLIHTFRDILFPSKLTKYYIEGKRKYYVNPARLFIFMLIGLITLALYALNIENNDMGADKIYSRAEKSKMVNDYSLLVDTLDVEGHENILDTIKRKMFKNVRSLKNDTLGKGGPVLFNLSKPVEEFGISSYDAIHMSQDELFEKYKVEKFWDKINVGQYIRVVTNPVGGIKYVVKNLTWAVFITVLLMSFFMKIIYIRKPFYLVEHVVLILNSHSMLFLLTAINLIILVYVPDDEDSGTLELVCILSTVFLIFFIQFLSLKKYYKQGIFMTLFKQLLINSAYLFIFNMVVIMVAIISLILY